MKMHAWPPRSRLRWVAGVRTATGSVLSLALMLGGTAGVGAQTNQPVQMPETGQTQQVPSTGRDSLPASFSQMVKDKLPAVVNVSTTQTASDEETPFGPLPEMPDLPPDSPFRDFFERFFGEGMPRPPGPLQALGSGFIIDPEGYVVTNNHVVAEADEISVILQDDTELEARLVGRDPRTDLALLKVESEEPLPALEWGDSDTTEVGDWVLAVGNPFGLGGTVTAGIISARARNIEAGPYDDFLQTDASINRGNSGGPLFAMDGTVIGVATAIFSPTGGNIGIGFAIPSADAQPIIDELRRTGTVQRGWLGVTIQPVTPEAAEALGLQQPRGALVSNVADGSPAAEAGVQVGDVILRFSGREISDVRSLSRAVAETPIGQATETVIWRDGEEVTLSPEIALLQEPEAEVPGAEAQPPQPTGPLGLALAPMSPEARAQFGIDEEATGVVVADVAPGSVAEQSGLEPGDVITQVGREKVTEPADITTAIDEARRQNRESILILREREDVSLFVTVPLDARQG